tara:strand:- start:141 stop:758 length:618 start_codon:yes stop_codon:yes gene_type:complete
MVVDPKLIGISGKIGNGKDLLFDIINYIVTEDYWTSFEHYMHESTPVDVIYQNKKFAGILKDITCKLIGCNVSQLEDREFKEAELGREWNGLTPRKILQLLGTEAGRQIIHPNIWVNALFANFATNSKWIVTDVRFPNEANIIKEKGGIMIRINRPGTESHCGGQHLSETSLDAYDKFDYVIENDGTVQDLIDKVKSLNIVKRIL